MVPDDDESTFDNDNHSLNDYNEIITIKMSMTLRTTILKHALPHLPEHSFTLRPLLNSLNELPANHPDRNDKVTPEVLDVLFGSELNARRELVKAWEEEGLNDMIAAEIPKGVPEIEAVGEILARRLEYSSRIGEHLVEVCLSHFRELQPDEIGFSITIFSIIFHLPTNTHKNTLYHIINAPLYATTIQTPLYQYDPPRSSKDTSSIILITLGDFQQPLTPLPNEPSWTSCLCVENIR